MCVFSVWEIGSGQKMCHSSSATLGLASPPVVQDPGRQVSHILFDGVLLLDQGLPLGPMSTSWWHFRNIPGRERELMHINMTDCVSHMTRFCACFFGSYIWIISWGPFRSWVCTAKLLWCATGCCLHWLRNYLALASQNLGNCLLSWAGSEDERVLVETCWNPRSLVASSGLLVQWAHQNQCDMLHGSIVSCSARFGEEFGKCELFPLNYGSCVCARAFFLMMTAYASICVAMLCYLLCLIKIN